VTTPKSSDGNNISPNPWTILNTTGNVSTIANVAKLPPINMKLNITIRSHFFSVLREATIGNKTTTYKKPLKICKAIIVSMGGKGYHPRSI